MVTMGQATHMTSVIRRSSGRKRSRSPSSASTSLSFSSASFSDAVSISCGAAQDVWLLGQFYLSFPSEDRLWERDASAVGQVPAHLLRLGGAAARQQPAGRLRQQEPEQQLQERHRGHRPLGVAGTVYSQPWGLCNIGSKCLSSFNVHMQRLCMSLGVPTIR